MIVADGYDFFINIRLLELPMQKQTLINQNMLRDMFLSAKMSNQGQEFEFTCKILGRTIRISERDLNNALQLPVHNFKDVPNETEILNFFNEIFYNKNASGKLPKKINIKYLPKQ